MKKILSKLLLFILGVVVLACALIVACGVNKDVAATVSAFVKSLNIHIEVAAEEDAEKDKASNTGNASEGSQSEDGLALGDTLADAAGQIQDALSLTDTSDSAAEVSSESFIQTQEKSFSEYLGDWSSTGLNSEVVDVENTEQPMVNEDIEENVAYYSTFDDMSAYYLPEANVVNLESSEQVKDAMKDTGMGFSGNNLSFDSTYYPYYNMLSSKCKALYRQIYANAQNLRTTFLPVENATPSEWNNAYLSVIYDHPELFWLDTRMYTEYDYGGKVVKVQISFYEDFSDITEARQAFEDKANEIVAMAAELKKDTEKEQFVHDYLANKLTYAEAPLNQSAYSAIVNNETVCAGYAKAFQYIMQKLEIPTYLCVGWGGGLISGGMHGWNIVKLGKKYVNVDVTWDDQNPVIYDYYNKNDADFHRHTRMFSSQYLPACK